MAVALHVAGCASIDVQSTPPPADVDFASLQTFHIVPVQDAEGRPYLEIDQAIERELMERGRSRVGPEQADMWIVYRANATDRRKRRNAGDPDSNAFRIVSYVEGTLAIDVFEQAGVRRVWHAQAVVDEDSRERLRARAGDVVEAIFEEFPSS